MTPTADTADAILRAAVAEIGGAPREGQQRMSQAVEQALSQGHHLLVQAGTGTGKSLGYLAPVLAYLKVHRGERVVIATATLALQAQLASSDIPHALRALEKETGHRATTTVLKGRSNYACLRKVRDGGAGQAEQHGLFGGADMAATVRDTGADETSVLGAEVLALREWAESQAGRDGAGDRDDAPTHGPRAWSQVSVSARECVGANRCQYGQECFAELARERARGADVVVTNHALLAIDAMGEARTLPEHSAVVIDEAHELVSRVTGAASGELSPLMVDRTAKRALEWLEDDTALDLMDAAEALGTALDGQEVGRITPDHQAVVGAAGQIRDLSRDAISQVSKATHGSDTERREAQAGLQDIFEVAERVAALSEADVVWSMEREGTSRELRVAPLSVAGLMRGAILSEVTAIFTSATLQVGGDFTKVAGSFGLRSAERVDAAGQRPAETSADEVIDDTMREAAADQDLTAQVTHTPVSQQDEALTWSAIDVGSPFQYDRQGILYLASDLPKPGREATTDEVLTMIAQLVWAADGRTLGLFSSMRAAKAAADHVRAELPTFPVLLQGEAHLAELTARFVAEERSSLFGTLSLWQGVDVPGEACRLVIMDKIPFPRPDDPLMQARQEEVQRHGGNGFMSVAATHAALLLAQGSGRLIRRTDDRGVVAVLDPRIVTARYGSFLRASMPPMWVTHSAETAVGALQRLGERTPGP